MHVRVEWQVFEGERANLRLQIEREIGRQRKISNSYNNDQSFIFRTKMFTVRILIRNKQPKGPIDQSNFAVSNTISHTTHLPLEVK